MARHRHSLIALFIFIVLAAALLHRALLPGYTLLPLDLIQSIAPWDHLELGPLANPLISDPFYSFYPRRHFLTTAIQNGRIPLWNPTILAGTPTIANPNFQTFYPPNLLAALILPAHHALPWLAWAHLVLTGWLTYGFLKRNKLHWFAAILGGGVWMLNGYIVVWLENPHRLSTLAWLPGIFWAYQKATEERRADVAMVGGLLLGLSILGGQMQFIFAAGLILGVYAMATTTWRWYKERRADLWPATSLLTIGLIGLGIGSIILLPASELAAVSQRVRFNPESVMQSRWPWRHLVTLLSPDFYGNPVTTMRYWGPFNYAELTAYFGIAPLLLALTAPFVARRHQFLVGVLAMTVFSLALVFGTPLVRLLFLFPGAPFVVLNRLLFLLPLCGAWLAALALDGWIAAPARRRWSLVVAWLVLVAITAGVLGVQQATPETHLAAYHDLLRSGIVLLVTTGMLLLTRHRRASAGLLVVLAMIEMWEWGRDFNPIVSTEYLYPENEVVNYLRRDEGHFRVLPLQAGKLVFGPNVLGVFGLQTIGGYTPLIQSDYYDFYKAISDELEFAWLDSSPNKLAMSVFEPEVNLLNVKYVLSARELPRLPQLQVEQTGCNAALPAGEEWQTQTFMGTAPGLNRVDILLAPQSSEQTAVTFALWREEVGGDLVAQLETTVEELHEPAPHTMFFAPVADAAGQRFVWGVRGDGNASVCVGGDGDTLSFAAYGTQLIAHGQQDGIWIYENANTLPRAYTVHHLETVAPDDLLARLHEPGFNYYHSALLTVPLPDEQAGQLAERPLRPQGQVAVTSYDLHEVTVSATLPRPGFLVLVDAYHPGWRATLDGDLVDVFRVNGVVRGVFLPAGAHEVVFQFRPVALYWGLALAGLSVAVATLVIVGSRIYRRGANESARPG